MLSFVLSPAITLWKHCGPLSSWLLRLPLPLASSLCIFLSEEMDETRMKVFLLRRLMGLPMVRPRTPVNPLVPTPQTAKHSHIRSQRICFFPWCRCLSYPLATSVGQRLDSSRSQSAAAPAATKWASFWIHFTVVRISLTRKHKYWFPLLSNNCPSTAIAYQGLGSMWGAFSCDDVGRIRSLSLSLIISC